MAGHANFEAKRRFYLPVSDDLVDKARTASEKEMASFFIAKPLQQPKKKNIA